MQLRRKFADWGRVHGKVSRIASRPAASAVAVAQRLRRLVRVPHPDPAVEIRAEDELIADGARGGLDNLRGVISRFADAVLMVARSVDVRTSYAASHSSRHPKI